MKRSIKLFEEWEYEASDKLLGPISKWEDENYEFNNFVVDKSYKTNAFTAHVYTINYAPEQNALHIELDIKFSHVTYRAIMGYFADESVHWYAKDRSVADSFFTDIEVYQTELYEMVEDILNDWVPLNYWSYKKSLN